MTQEFSKDLEKWEATMAVQSNMGNDDLFSLSKNGYYYDVCDDWGDEYR